MDQPWTEAWLSFNLCPARWVHASRRTQFLPASMRVWGEAGSGGGRIDRIVHRHWSAAFLQDAAWDPVERLDDPVLPIALLPDPEFERLALWCGLVVIASAVRQVISREEVATLTQSLGEDGLDFARHRAGVLAGRDALHRLDVSDVRAAASRLGGAMLALALAEGAPPLAHRATWRLPTVAGQAVEELPEGLAAGPAALGVARAVLHEMDPQWLSSFPTAH
ncbi:SctK family type III secretion system sorting platform protein [Ramlibacter sp. MAHUQ-53]